MHESLFIGKNVISLETIDSTNDYAKQLLSTQKPTDGTLIIAKAQTKGRGQLGNIWQTESGKNLTVSYILYPNFLSPDKQFYLNMAVALGIREFCESICAEHVQIKWPNDIYFEGRKLAGILCERIHGDPRSIIIGIGVNVNAREFPAEIVATATSLAQVCTEEQNIRALWIRICRSLAHRLRRATALLSPQTINEFNAHAWRYILRPEISAAPLEFQTLLADGRAQCKDGIILDMAG